ncbi:hypothetical protein NXG27_00845 [Megasphaera paucivorans]|uniref:Uncharacterized protein n=1 Tax=Megasphaera paucivorans TaxID=349095 RepID=A0A1G9QAL3_9FIRM|nr:hypothetical protein [Megasphaera paucivorans]SDM08108.1 hypothetical protein SAMN05660299_00171 [Megasphaera paucivorans]
MLNFIKKHKKIIVCVVCAVVVAVLLGIGLYFYLHHEKTVQEAPKVMKYPDTTNPGKLKNTLDVDDGTANQLVKQIEYIHDGEIPPETIYYVTAPTLKKAANDTADDIKTTMDTGKNTKNLPTAAVEKTDRTVVTANTEQQQVDVYKINLRNNHKLKGGVLYHDNGLSVGAGYQAGKWESMAYAGHGKPDYAVNYTWKEW